MARRGNPHWGDGKGYQVPASGSSKWEKLLREFGLDEGCAEYEELAKDPRIVKFIERWHTKRFVPTVLLRLMGIDGSVDLGDSAHEMSVATRRERNAHLSEIWTHRHAERREREAAQKANA